MIPRDEPRRLARACEPRQVQESRGRELAAVGTETTCAVSPQGMCVRPGSQAQASSCQRGRQQVAQQPDCGRCLVLGSLRWGQAARTAGARPSGRSAPGRCTEGAAGQTVACTAEEGERERGTGEEKDGEGRRPPQGRTEARCQRAVGHHGRVPRRTSTSAAASGTSRRHRHPSRISHDTLYDPAPESRFVRRRLLAQPMTSLVSSANS